MLCRTPIDRGQRVLFKLALERASQEFRSSEVRNWLDFDQSQHRGLMSALTGRINRSPHEVAPDTNPGLGQVFTMHWDGTENTYVPKPELLEAIHRLPALEAALSLPMNQVLEDGTPPIHAGIGAIGILPSSPPRGLRSVLTRLLDGR